MNNLYIKKVSTLVLQIVIILIGVSSLAFILWEPTIEGRNVHATLFEVYFKDPFLAYVYIASIPFFVLLYQAFKLSGYRGQSEVFLQHSVRALRMIKYCAVTLVSCIVMPVAYLFVVRPGDDIAGGVAIGLFLIFVFTVIAITSSIFERTLQNKK